MRPLAWLALAASLSPALARADEPTWVFFADRGRDDPAATRALAQRTSELSPRALQRRRRARGDAGVDVRDLPPAPAYVAAVLATGAELRHHSRWLNAISVDATPAQRAAIATLPAVARVQPVVRRPRSPAPPLDLTTLPPRADEDMYGHSWQQLSLLGVPFLHDCGLTGAGVVIGVQDSGFTLAHQALANVQVIAAHDFVKGDDIVADEPGDPDGQDHHGTMVLSQIVGDDPGTFMGAAPGAAVILAKTEDVALEEPFEEDLFVAGLEWIEAQGADLFTASLGYLAWYEPADLDGQTAVTTQAAEIAAAQGLIVLASIGNAGPGPTTMSAPADAEAVISVGAVDLGAVVTDFSSRGPTADGRIKPNIVAPGLDVAAVHPDAPTEYVPAKGTSFAAPLAAGAAALLLEAFPDLTPAEMRAMLQSAASQADAPDNAYGWGLLDASKPAFLLCTCTDADADGHHASACGGDDCDDALAATHPGALEVCDGRDNDCDGQLPADEHDADADGAPACSDCDDADPAVAPDQIEVCDDAVDNDCDLQVDAADPACQAAPTTGAVPTIAAEASSDVTGDPGSTPPDGGCGCAASSPAPLWLLLLAARRRRRHQPR